MSGGIVVFAYSGIGHACLAALLEQGERVEALFTHEDAPNERMWFASCATLASAQRVPVYTMVPEDGAEMVRIVAPLQPQLILSIYYRHLIPMKVLSLAARGAFNIHGSLLPKYRGRAPVNWAVLHGETETGVSLHHMIDRADAGDIVDQERVPIGPEDTAGDVSAKLEPAAVALLLRQLPALKAGTAPRRSQDESEASYFGGRRPEDGRIDWAMCARSVVNLVRAVAPPFPGAFTTLGARRLMVWRARPAPGHGTPGEVLSLQPLVIASGEGAIELQYYGFEGEDENAASPTVQAALAVGARLGD